MDDERLKNPPVGSSVLERIRDIHASMRRVDWPPESPDNQYHLNK
ncbi:putative RhuM-like cytoplasmic protein [Escherichia coli]|nr:putative RhuM-like cytoplasmic protein [Escherichia coli]